MTDHRSAEGEGREAKRPRFERAKRAAPCCEHCVELYEDLAPKLAHVTINDGRQFSFLRNSYGFLECMVLSDDEREPYIGDTDEDTLEWAIGRVVM